MELMLLAASLLPTIVLNLVTDHYCRHCIKKFKIRFLSLVSLKYSSLYFLVILLKFTRLATCTPCVSIFLLFFVIC